jgi:hypothetical protein
MAAPGGLDQDCAQDAAIKLFGRNIPVLHSSVFAATAAAASEVGSNSLSSRIHSLTRDGDLSWSTGSRGGAGWSLLAVSEEKGEDGKAESDTLFLPPAFALSNACWWIMVPAGILVAVAAKKLFLLEPCLILYLITKKLWVYVFAPSVFVREFSSNTCFFTKLLFVFTAVFTVRFMLVYPLLRF